MKPIQYITCAIIFIALSGAAYASFHIKKSAKHEQTPLSNNETTDTAQFLTFEEEPALSKLRATEKIASLKDSPSKEEPRTWDILSILGFIFGVLSLLIVFEAITLPFSIAAIILSSKGLKKTSNGKKGRGLAITGLISGILGVLVFLLVVLVLVLLF